MIYINPQDQERLLRMAAIAAANIAVEVILSTEPFKSAMQPRILELPATPEKPKRKYNRRKAKKT
jgi:hypothetical protein